jgi:hypothetical protein
LQDFIPNPGPIDKIYLLLGAIASAGATLTALRPLPIDQTALLSAIAIASLSFLSTQVSRPLLWWMGTGAIAGITVGQALVVKGSLDEGAVALEFRDRLIILGLQGLAGFISGALLGRKLHKTRVPPLDKFLARVSALTLGLFSLVVTASFLFEGLEVARTLSSRLSATTTILATTLAIPGLIGYLLFELENPRHRPSP